MRRPLCFLIFDNIYLRFGYKVYRQIIALPMGTNCASLVADLFCSYYKRNFMTSLSDDNQSDVIEVFEAISRY